MSLKAAVVVIGNEILSGRTQDQNLCFIAQKLRSVGITVSEARIIPDVESSIVSTIRELTSGCDYVFTTGGIGPTHDDITSKSVAKALGLKCTLHPEADKIISDFYAKLGKAVNPASQKMAYIPENAKLLRNPVSGAPGFTVGNLYVLPGIPHIMQEMLEILLLSLKRGPAIVSQSLDLLVGESIIAARLEALQTEHSNVDIGSYPYTVDGLHATSVVLTSSDTEALDKVYQKLTYILQEYQRVC
jgi:molybdenum cofactor synthesis domain-containing protein